MLVRRHPVQGSGDERRGGHRSEVDHHQSLRVAIHAMLELMIDLLIEFGRLRPAEQNHRGWVRALEARAEESLHPSAQAQRSTSWRGCLSEELIEGGLMVG